MRALPADHRLPLPRGWSERIRSAVIHVISLAHASLTLARSVAANSINARIRLKADINRLRHELALLTEEMRMKDARMERTSPLASSLPRGPITFGTWISVRFPSPPDSGPHGCPAHCRSNGRSAGGLPWLWIASLAES
jgi:hypothetical protein